MPLLSKKPPTFSPIQFSRESSNIINVFKILFYLLDLFVTWSSLDYYLLFKFWNKLIDIGFVIGRLSKDYSQDQLVSLINL